MAMEITIDSDMGGGEYVQVKLSNGKVVRVWDESVDNSKFGVVEVFESIDAIEAGELPIKAILV
jgi:hypothetical protein